MKLPFAKSNNRPQILAQWETGHTVGILYLMWHLVDANTWIQLLALVSPLPLSILTFLSILNGKAS